MIKALLKYFRLHVNDYYPFGLEYNAYQRENALLNKYQFNGKEIQNELELVWNDVGARMYTSEIGGRVRG
jgi:hypothetical protein